MISPAARWIVAVALCAPCRLPLAAQATPQVAPVPPSSGATGAEPAVASYLSSRLNGKPLPVTDRASDSTGTQYLVEFAELILSIRPGHEFRASLRFRQALAIKGDRLREEPIQKTTIYGSWSAAGNQLHFVPDPKRGGSGLSILAGTFAGTRIEVPFDYRNGSVVRRATVVLIKNDNIF